MFTRLKSALHLTLTTGSVPVRATADLDALLKSRTAPSPAALARLLESSDAMLKQRIRDFSALSPEITHAMAGDAATVRRTFDRIQAIGAPEDHDWPVILASLAGAEGDVLELQHTALSYFLQYANAAHDLMRSILRNRAPAAADPEANNKPERQLLNMDDVLPPVEFMRLAKGDTLNVELIPHQALQLRLSRYRFLLIAGEPFRLVDDTGHDYTLKPGKNIVGRNDDCDVVIDAAYHSISRRHVIIDVGGEDPIRITDLSSHGTSVPIQAASAQDQPRLH